MPSAATLPHRNGSPSSDFGSLATADVLFFIAVPVIVFDASERLVLANGAALGVFTPLTDRLSEGTPAATLFEALGETLQAPAERSAGARIEQLMLAALRDPPARLRLRLSDDRWLVCSFRRGGGFVVVSFSEQEGGGETADPDDPSAPPLGEQVTRLKAQLVEAEKRAAVSTMVAGIAHESATPVSIIVGAVTSIEDDVGRIAGELEGGTLTAEDLGQFLVATRAKLRLLARNADRAATLISNFKTVAVDQASQERRVFDLLTYLEEVMTTLGPALRRQPIDVVIDCQPGIVLDTTPGPLAQVVTNLVLNAIAHGLPDRRHGTITLQAIAMQSDRVVLVIADDGAGIPPAVLPHIFDPFFTTRRGQGGSGLGLHIVKTIVETTLGGRIEVESDPGAGTRFIIDIPRHGPDGR